MRSLRNVDVKNKKVLLRTDFNISVENGKITDDFRIKAILPTLNYLIEHEAITIILSHAGRPEGKDALLSLRPATECLSDILSKEVLFFETYEDALEKISLMKGGEVAILENLRFYKEEYKASDEFAGKLAKLGEIYVNDAFAVSHREQTSVYNLPKLMYSYAGFLLEKEATVLEEVRKADLHPLVFVMGGAKLETKIKLFAKLLYKIDHICLGGLLANSVLALKGVAIGKSKFETGLENYLDHISITDIKIHLPVDVVLSKDITGTSATRIVAVGDVKADEMILDIGPDSVNLFKNIIEEAKMVVWNGPMGAFESRAFANGTYELAKALKNTKAKVVIGGGDVMRAVHEVSAQDSIFYVSTGGGAMLEYLAEGTLPGLKVLEFKQA